MLDGAGQPVLHTHQKRAEEDEGDKVDVGEVRATGLVGGGFGSDGCVILTFLPPQTGQHDLLPGLPSGTPAVTARAQPNITTRPTT